MTRKPSKKRRKDGRFRVRYNYKYFYSTISYADAERQAKEYRKKLEAGMSADAMKMTVREYAGKWLAIHKADVSDKTYDDYARLLNALIAECGDYACSAITPDDARKVFAKHFKPKKTVDSPGYSGSTIKRARMLYISMFDAAVENRICTSNPFRSRVAKPSYGADGSHRAITDEERELILTNDHWFQPAVMAMLYAGLRRGEALALNLDTDLEASGDWLNIHQAIRFEGNRPVLDEPKTDAGKRRIPVFPPLRPYVVNKKGLLAPSRQKGGYMTEASFRSAWRSYVASIEHRINTGLCRRWLGLSADEKANNPARYAEYVRLLDEGKKKEAEQLRLSDYTRFTVRPHDLRHSFCVMLRDAGVDMKQTIEWMGHADEKMVLRIYDHLGTKRATDSVQKVENLLRKGQ